MIIAFASALLFKQLSTSTRSAAPVTVTDAHWASISAKRQTYFVAQINADHAQYRMESERVAGVENPEVKRLIEEHLRARNDAYQIMDETENDVQSKLSTSRAEIFRRERILGRSLMELNRPYPSWIRPNERLEESLREELSRLRSQLSPLLTEQGAPKSGLD
jgi:hypothetical protein